MATKVTKARRAMLKAPSKARLRLQAAQVDPEGLAVPVVVALADTKH